MPAPSRSFTFFALPAGDGVSLVKEGIIPMAFRNENLMVVALPTAGSGDKIPEMAATCCSFSCRCSCAAESPGEEARRKTDLDELHRALAMEETTLAMAA
jgi:hypothetical protein